MIGRAKRFFASELVLVYTMGKVGSTSIEARLEHGFHTHTLYGFPPSPAYHRQKFGTLGVALRRLTVYPVKRLMLRARKRIRIVTLYRDPKTRNPSMFMQDLPFWLSEHLLAAKNANRAESGDLLLKAYKADFPHEYPAEWVEKELSRFTGIPAGDLALGRDDFKIVSQGRYEVFIGRMERMDHFADEVYDFVGLPPGDVSAVNRGEHKWYAPVYGAFREDLKAAQDISFCDRFRAANGYDDA